ncbi:hypothetical protein Poli38472_012227 [Pythium oligandrum]|uniref:Uncharacterized protein n=1 Tax=Pythium oligandrum TaxID=41045 RepID=A0A8K1FLG2_PYTOL|nr:hypothetical protein Poli38472_012227 [Pythium oligandrum]|eukprot:TMW67111.1 hypothetical protein Poli38472_012227 [Pythium oligandrum]
MEGEKEYVFVLKHEKPREEEGCESSETRSLADSDESLAIVGALEASAELVSEPEDGVEADLAPLTLPFLPTLDASTQITKFDGYSEAIVEAQTALDSRLLAYSRYLSITQGNDNLLTPRTTLNRVPVPSKPLAGDRPVTVCMGWQRVSNIDSSSRDLLRVLEEDGVTYMPHDIAYSVKYLAPVAPFGDCLWLSIEQLLLYTEECEPLPTSKIRRVASKFFLAHYKSCTDEEKARIDTAIRNLYFPSLKGGWGVSPMQTRRFIARKSDKDWLFAKCVELQDQGYSRVKAAEAVYTKYTQPVTNAEAYCDYMSVGNGENTHFLIALNYSRSGLVSIDADPENCRVAWGDDLALEALATAYQRDIFVVLVGCGKMFFLPHRPRSVPGLEDLGHTRSKGNAPWFLLMRLTGSDRGGDHYEPMLCERLRGDGSMEFGCIGD